MDAKRMTKVSRFLSLVLRHEPGKIGVVLDSAGWVGVEELLEGMKRVGMGISREELEEVVRGNDKKRFAFSEDGGRIRASQGHSVGVELGYEAAEPPGVLFHGTVGRFLASIRERGLVKGERHDVHLSEREETAVAVGERRGEAVVLRVRAGEMFRDGFVFRRSANGVWLTEAVPAKYLDFPGGGRGDKFRRTKFEGTNSNDETKKPRMCMRGSGGLSNGRWLLGDQGVARWVVGAGGSQPREVRKASAVWVVWVR